MSKNKYKKLAVTKEVQELFSKHCKKQRVLISDFAGLLIDKLVENPPLKKKDKIKTTQIVVSEEHAEKFKEYCKKHELQMLETFSELLKLAVDHNLKIETKIKE